MYGRLMYLALCLLSTNNMQFLALEIEQVQNLGVLPVHCFLILVCPEDCNVFNSSWIG